MRDASGILECRSSSLAILRKSVGTWNGQADARPLDPSEESCAVSVGAWSLGSRIPSSGSDEHD